MKFPRYICVIFWKVFVPHQILCAVPLCGMAFSLHNNSALHSYSNLISILALIKRILWGIVQCTKCFVIYCIICSTQCCNFLSREWLSAEYVNKLCAGVISLIHFNLPQVGITPDAVPCLEKS